VARQIRMATCHPDRKHCGHGLCKPCFARDYHSKHKPAPKPPRNTPEGRRFGRLLVFERIGKKEHGGHIIWRCVCDCGKEKGVTTANLYNGTQSCGCLQREVARATHFPDNRVRPYEAIYNVLCSASLARDIDVTISYDGFVHLTNTEVCYYCYAPITWAKHNTAKNGHGYNLDRKDNALGYHLANVVVCCSRCNLSKGNRFSHDEWFDAMHFLRVRHGSKEITSGSNT
jgi:hypothetical protein